MEVKEKQIDKVLRFFSLFLSAIATIAVFTGLGGWTTATEMRIKTLEEFKSDKDVHMPYKLKSELFITRREYNYNQNQIKEDLAEIKEIVKTK